jgi:hypothetical protein
MMDVKRHPPRKDQISLRVYTESHLIFVQCFAVIIEHEMHSIVIRLYFHSVALTMRQTLISPSDNACVW